MSCEPDGTLHDPDGRARGPGRRPGPLRGRRRGGGSPRTICASCASSASRPGSAVARRTRRRWPPAPSCAEGIDALSGERVRQELWLILLGPRPAATLALMRAAGVLARVVPGAVSLDRLERLAEPDALLRLAALIRPSSAAAGGGAGGSAAACPTTSASGCRHWWLPPCRISRPASRRSGWRSTGSGHDSTRPGAARAGGGRHRRRRGGRAAGDGGGLAAA